MASNKIKIHMLRITDSTFMLCDSAHKPEIDEALKDTEGITCLKIPSQDEWVTETVAEKMEYDGDFESARGRGFLILHSSGTTGLPKPIIYTNDMMTAHDVAHTSPLRIPLLSYEGRRLLLCTGLSHSSGIIISLQIPVYGGASIVLCAPSSPPSSSSALSVLTHPGAKVGAMAASPVLYRDLARTEAGLSALRKLSLVLWAGAPLDSTTGDLLAGHVTLLPGFGTTECGHIFTLPAVHPADWLYMRFAPHQGITFVHHEGEGEGLHELVIRRIEEGEKKLLPQQIFEVRPDLEEYASGDLYRCHEEGEGRGWMLVGRRDDMLVLLNGLNVDAPGVEAALAKHPSVSNVFVGGQGRPHIFALIGVPLEIQEKWDSDSREKFWEELRPLIAEANEQLTQSTALRESYILVTDRPLITTAKGQVNRKKTLLEFEREIEKLMQHS